MKKIDNHQPIMVINIYHILLVCFWTIITKRGYEKRHAPILI